MNLTRKIVKILHSKIHVKISSRVMIQHLYQADGPYCDQYWKGVSLG